MAIVDNDIGLLLLIVHNPQALELLPFDLGPANGRGKDAMSGHSKAQKGQGNGLGKEDAAEKGRHVGKSEAYKANHQILEWCCFLHKRGAVFILCEVAAADELVGYGNDYGW